MVFFRSTATKMDQPGAERGEKLQRSIGLFGAAATLVGYVVGASIFILPGELAPSTGPAVFVAYLLASLPALLSCFVTAQIGCAYPVSGALYVAASRSLSPFWGFMLVWSLLMGVMVAIPLIAYGFADYLAFFVAGWDPKLVAFGAVICFTAINLMGVRLSVGAQSLMALGFILALVVFGVGGFFHIEPGNLSPLFPRGFGPVALAAIPAFFSFIGFTMIADVAGEVKRPGWTIPRALALAFACVLFFYTLVPLTLVGVLPWTELDGAVAPVASAAARFLPASVASLISGGALLAAVTSLNGILLAISRDVYALAKDRILPEPLSLVSNESRSPNVAILTVASLGLVGVSVGATLTSYAVSGVMALMMVQILSAAAVLVLPKTSPERFRGSAFRLTPFWRVFCSIGLILYSLAFLGLGVVQSPSSATLFVALLLFGASYYLMRRRALGQRGLQIEDVLRKDAVLASAAD